MKFAEVFAIIIDVGNVITDLRKDDYVDAEIAAAKIWTDAGYTLPTTLEPDVLAFVAALKTGDVVTIDSTWVKLKADLLSAI